MKASPAAAILLALALPRCLGDGAGAPSGSLAGCPSPGGDAAAAVEGGAPSSGACSPGDSDGIVGGCYTFDLTVDDDGFSPIILKAQNLAQATVHLRNEGTRPHDFVLGCLAVSAPGCPGQVCFSPSANIPPVAPGASGQSTFFTPIVEGIYAFRSDVGPDGQASGDDGGVGLSGQFVVQ